MGAVQFHVPVGADDQDAVAPDVAGQVLQQQQRRLVRPVQVVQHQDDRSAAGRRPQEGDHGLEQPEALGVAVEARQGGDVAELLPDLGHQGGDLGRRGPEVLADLVLGLGLDVGPEALGEGQVRRPDLPLVAPTPEDLGAPDLGLRHQLLHEGRLADARLAGDEDEAGAPRQRRFERGPQLVELRRAAHEASIDRGRRRGRSRHQRSRRERDGGQRGDDVSSIAGTLVGVFGQEAAHEGIQSGRDGGVVEGGVHRGGVDVLGHDFGEVPEEGRAPRHQLVEHGPEGVQVTAGVGIPSDGDLGRQVRRRAHDHPLGGQPGLVGHLSQAEVAEQGVAGGVEPDVGRLDVPVHDALRVGAGQALGHLAADPDGVDQFQATVRRRQAVLQRAAREELGDDEGSPVLLAGVEDGDHVRVVAEAGHRPGLTLHPSPAVGVEAIGLDQGDGDVAPEPAVGPPVHHLAGALAEPVTDLVPTVAHRARGARLDDGQCAATAVTETGPVPVLPSTPRTVQGPAL